MSSYVVLARKWRPAQFSDIVGQASIVRTLMNAVRAERIHQAYLFTGSRGIGKTSIARIFAKVLRCPSVTDTPEAGLRSCGTCPSCTEIAAGTGTDVLEIDGASNNGVDAVRELRENVRYMPANGGRKIIIIDEVHMLTTAAFNALLKTLEEPPEHVVFILATTEPHKIPPTILSRCQRFDYRRVTVAQIQARLQEIITAEGLSAEPAALSLIARAAEGSMRDSLSLLDQVIAFSGGKLTAESVRESVGLIASQTLTAVLRGVLARKPLDALKVIDEAYAQGHDLRVLARGLIEQLHAAIVLRIGTQPAGTEFSEDELRELGEIAALRDLEELEVIFQVLHHGLEAIARSPQPKLVLDVLVIKCASAEALVSVASLASVGSAQAVAAPVVAPVAAAPVMVAPLAPVPAVSVAAPLAPASAPIAVAPVVAVAKSVSAAPSVAAAPAVKAPAPAPTQAAPISWEGFITHVRSKRPLLGTILEHGSVISLPSASADLQVGFSAENSYYQEQLQARVYFEQLTQMMREYFGQPQAKIQFQVREGGESVASRRERETQERETQAKQAASTHPILVEARALFGGEMGPIEVQHAGP